MQRSSVFLGCNLRVFKFSHLFHRCDNELLFMSHVELFLGILLYKIKDDYDEQASAHAVIRNLSQNLKFLAGCSVSN